MLEKFFQAISNYWPNIKRESLKPDYAGIRPKINNNSNFSDYYISHEIKSGLPNWINLIGIESPGLTSAIAIGEEIVSWVNDF